MKIQKPTIGRIVEFTAFRGHETRERDAYAAVITKVYDRDSDSERAGCTDLVTFGPNSVYFQHGVPHDADGEAMTWRYPPRSTEEIETLK